MDYATIRERVRAARRARGLSQEGLAVESDTGRVTIARFEGGKDQDLRVGTLMRLCRPLELELAVLPADAHDPEGRIIEREREQRRRVERRLQHAALSARLLLMPERMARASLARAAAVVDRWRRDRAHPARHVASWRRILAGSREHVARDLLRHNERMDSLFEASPFEPS